MEVVDGERDVTLGDLVVLGGGAGRLLVPAEDGVLLPLPCRRRCSWPPPPWTASSCPWKPAVWSAAMLAFVVAMFELIWPRWNFASSYCWLSADISFCAWVSCDSIAAALALASEIASPAAGRAKPSTVLANTVTTVNAGTPTRWSNLLLRDDRGAEWFKSPLYVSHDGQHSYRAPLAVSNTIGAKRVCAVVLEVRNRRCSCLRKNFASFWFEGENEIGCLELRSSTHG